MTKQTKLLIIIGAAVLLILAAGGIFLHLERSRFTKERADFAALEKERMEEELEQLQADYGVQMDKIQDEMSYGEQFMHLSSDSLMVQLSRERARVERLADELRQTKATDNKRIKELSSEITSLRKVLRSYIVQVDSLQQLNASLRRENEEIRTQYVASEQKANQLKAEKGKLSEQVTRAARLEATQLSCATLDRHGKTTRRINRIATLRFDLIIGKNITAEPGARRIYMRILNPYDQPIAGPQGEQFKFEGTTLTATASREIEYGGETLPVSLFWNVNETLLEGRYRVDFFSDGAIIGQISFTLGK